MTSKLRVIPYVILLLPLDVIVAIGILLAQLCGKLFPSSQRRGGCAEGADGVVRPAGMFRRTDHPGAIAPPLLCEEGNVVATIVIVNFDGKHLLAECLPALIEAVKCAGGNHEILVVDNGSADGSTQFVQENFPEVRLLALDQNYGFTGGNNRAAQSIETDIIVFLNNDMVVDRGFLQPLLGPFSDPSVFAVTSQIFFADATRRREETGKTRARFDSGFFYFWHDEMRPEDKALQTMPVLWAGGGSCAVDRKKFLTLGGFDSLYHPFYFEDTDVSYQAWKRGWKCLLAPASRVVHKHRATTKAKFPDRFVETTVRRNQYLFTWKNLTDTTMILQHVANLPRAHARGMVQHDPLFEMQAFLRAFRRLPEALTKRLSHISRYTIPDREVLARSQKS